MARLAAQEKGLYYPTPLARIDELLPVIEPLEPGNRYRLLDPCCGEGRALARLAELLNQRQPDVSISTWGIEINEARAAAAYKRLGLVINAPFEMCGYSPSRRNQAASLVLLNPPYDTDSLGDRMERTFLDWALPWMQPGALLIYIIPHRTMSWDTAQYLFNHFDGRQIYRFPDEDGPGGFDAFHQLVFLGFRRDPGLTPEYDYTAIQTLYRQAYLTDATANLPTGPEGIYSLPATANATMWRRSYRPEEVTQLCANDALTSTAAAQLYPAHEQMPDPLLPPRDGHIGMMVASGIMSTLATKGAAFKGAAIKSQRVEETDDDTEKVRDIYTTHIARIDDTGLQHLTTPHQVAAFLKQHAGLFREHIRTNFQPYGGHVTEQENTILDTLSLDKMLPGEAKPGLRPHQRTVAVALTRSLDRYQTANLIGQMGYGKTRVALAATELRNAYPALVTCPPHLVDQWVEEAQAAVPGTHAIVVETITELETIQRTYQPGDKLIVVIATSRAKAGPGWQPAYPFRLTLEQPKNRTKHFHQAVEAYKAAKCAGAHNITQLRRAALELAIPVPVCPECGHPLIDGTSFASRHHIDKNPGHCRNPHGHTHWNAQHEQMLNVRCSSAVFQFAPTIARRWPLADYIARKMPRFFRIFIADEVHKHKSKGTDTGASFQQLANMLPTITLTGTFFGGKASSIFYLLYRTQTDVREEYEFDSESDWIDQFGVRERTYKTTEVTHGATTTLRRRQINITEKPGISPGIIRFIAATTAFGQVRDLELKMPRYHEEIATLGLGHTRQHIEVFQARTWRKMIDQYPHWTSAWLQWNLARPNSQFRREVIEAFSIDRLTGKPTDLVLPPQVDDEHPFLPKEEWLINRVKEELQRNRKVVIYPRQTGTRDIRQRLVDILHRSGVGSVAVLDSSIGTRRRRAWLQQHARPVLITNPRLVETGMNLHDYGYCSIIFYEIEYSLYTLWQAMSRVYRPGQTKPVNVAFCEYDTTLEQKALALIGQKMLAGQLLYGEDVAGALVEDAADDSIVLQLIEAIKNDQVLVSPTTIFDVGDPAELLTDSPIGSPIRRSHEILTIDEWLQERGYTREGVLQPKIRRDTKKRAALVDAGQMSLFQ